MPPMINKQINDNREIHTATLFVHLPCSSPKAVVNLDALFNLAAVCAMFFVKRSFSATLPSYSACS